MRSRVGGRGEEQKLWRDQGEDSSERNAGSGTVQKTLCRTLLGSRIQHNGFGSG